MNLDGVLILLILMVFTGGFVGALMSGGSLIVFTALAFWSIPVRTMIGTLKLAITVLGLASAGTYWKGGAVDVKKAPFLVLFSLPGAVLGALIVVSFPQEPLRILVILLLCVGTVASLRISFKTQSTADAPHEQSRLLPGLVGLALGIYIGMLGIASAILTISALMALFHLPMLEANGTGKTMIFANNLTASAVYLMNGSVDLILGLIISIPIAVGAWAGARVALKMSNNILRIIFVIMAAVAIVRLISETI